MANDQEILNAIQSGIPSISGWTIKSINATETLIKAGAGSFHSLYIGSLSTPSLTIYDNASGVSGTVVISLDANMPRGNYVYDLPITSGLASWATPGNAHFIKISYK